MLCFVSYLPSFAMLLCIFVLFLCYQHLLANKDFQLPYNAYRMQTIEGQTFDRAFVLGGFCPKRAIVRGTLYGVDIRGAMSYLRSNMCRPFDPISPRPKIVCLSTPSVQ